MFTREKIYQLEHGHSFGIEGEAFTAPGASLYKGGPGWYEACAAWQFLRTQILKSWIAGPVRPGEHGGPGTRPFMWWLVDAPERRRRVDGGIHPNDDPDRKAHIAKLEGKGHHRAGRFEHLYYGAPCCSLKGDGFDDFAAEYEAEFELLDRRDLWLDGELAPAVYQLGEHLAKLRAEYASGSAEPSQQDLDRLRRWDAVLVSMKAKLGATS